MVNCKLKRISVIILIMLILSVFAGCDQSKSISITDYSWKMTTVQNGENGSVIACSANDAALYPDAKEVEIICEAKNGKITINDMTNQKSYSGKCVVTERNAHAEMYDIQIENVTGKAVCGMTVYAEGGEKPTFIINFGDYILNFESE